ncbi:uncharacterized protein [Hetaerina americana]|uniref:uncharacterized protein n=1 Tax=Hetaerina americana TaxID=62018 RepID=UPI003A7F1E7C
MSISTDPVSAVVANGSESDYFSPDRTPPSPIHPLLHHPWVGNGVPPWNWSGGASGDDNLDWLASRGTGDAADEKLYAVPTGIIVLLSVLYGAISVAAVFGNALVIWIHLGSSQAASAHFRRKQLQRQLRNESYGGGNGGGPGGGGGGSGIWGSRTRGRILSPCSPPLCPPCGPCSAASPTDCFIANLALADVVVGLFCVPFQFQAALLQRWDLPRFMCAFCPFVQVLSVSASVLTLTAIAVDRHRAVLRPFSSLSAGSRSGSRGVAGSCCRSRPSSRGRARLTVAAIWVVGACLAAPMALALDVTEVLIDEPEPGGPVGDTPDWAGVWVDAEAVGHSVPYTTPSTVLTAGVRSSGRTKPFCSNVALSPRAMMVYRLILVAVQYVVPLTVISVVYARMVHRLWGARAPGNAQSARDANLTRNRRRVIKMLVIVVALFAICWLPLQTYNAIQDFFPEINGYKYINIIWFCSDWLAMSNSCCNPFIYGIYNDKFKREFRRRYRHCSQLWFLNRDGPPPSPSPSGTTFNNPTAVTLNNAHGSTRNLNSTSLRTWHAQSRNHGSPPNHSLYVETVSFHKAEPRKNSMEAPTTVLTISESVNHRRDNDRLSAVTCRNHYSEAGKSKEISL